MFQSPKKTTETHSFRVTLLSRLTSPQALWVLPLAFLGLFYFYPLGRIFVVSFADGGIGDAIAKLISSAYLQKVLRFTVWQAVVSTVLTLIAGLPAAWLVARFDFRGKALLRALTAIPFVMPTVVVATGFNALLGPRGWLNLGAMEWFGATAPPINILNTLWAILIAHIFYNLTIVVRLVGDFWRRLDPRLAQAAQLLGASRWVVFREVTFPLLAPAILSAALLIFIFDFTSFGVVLILGGPQYSTLEVEIYRQTVNFFNLPLAGLLSLLQLGATLGLTILYSRLSEKVSRPLKLRSDVVTQRKLDTWQLRLLATVIIGSLIIFLGAPLLALALRSVVGFGDRLGATRGVDGTGITFKYYQMLWVNTRNAAFFVTPIETIMISLRNALITVVMSLTLGIPTAWLLAKRGVMARWFDPIIMLPIGTSAVTLGFGFVIAFNRAPLNLRASPFLLPLAHTLVAFPFVVRSLLPAWRSIQERLRQAATVLGASPLQVWREVDLPLVGRAAAVAGAFAFTVSLGEFGATSILSRPEFPTIPVAIFRYLGLPGAQNYGQALALSTILMLFCSAGILVIENLRVGDVAEF